MLCICNGPRNIQMQRSTPHLRALEKMRLSIKHPIVQTPLIGLVEEQVEILERLGDPE